MSREAAIAVLALILETRPAGGSGVDHANRCLGSRHPARLMQSIILPGRPRPDYAVSLGTYTIKAFNADKILYWAERCGSRYPIDLRELNGWATLERTPFELSLIDWQRIIPASPMPGRWGLDSVAEEFLDYYYATVAKSVANEIEAKVKDDVLVLESGAMLWIGVEELLNTLFLKIVSLFSWDGRAGKAGWATLSDQSILHTNFPDAPGLERCHSWLRDELGFTGLQDQGPLQASIRTFCRVLQRAHGHRIAGRPDEAFLHFAIALDLLFGEEGKSSESVASRTALIVHRPLETQFEEQEATLKKLYKARSKYVHEGTGVSADDLSVIEAACTQALWALLWVSSHGSAADIDAWLKKIDFLVAALRADQVLPESEFRTVGAADHGRDRRTPMRVQYSPRRLASAAQ